MFIKCLQIKCTFCLDETLPKGTVLEEVGTMLARGAWELDNKGNKVPKVGKNGQTLKTKSGKVIYKRTPYKIKVFNTINFAKSMHYNPFAYIHTEQDVLKFVNTLIANTKGEGAQSGEDFWVKAERLLFTAYVAYIVKYCKKSERNFVSLLAMIDASETREEDEDFENAIDLMFKDIEFGNDEEGIEADPDSFAVRQYTYEVMKLFMIGTIARISCPGIKFEVMLCLVGGQGAGKSTFLRFLAMEDDWFTDDLKKMDDDNVYRKIQGHLIIEFPEMVAILNAKNVEDTKSFMSRQKDTYKTPYDRHPKDHKRQCVFAGSSNSLDFLPMDRSGNRRFLPILCNMEEAETHILDDEKTSREYIDQMWAEAMEIYRSGKCQLRLPKEMEKELCEYQKQFMQEDTKKELILDYLEHYEGSMVCSRQLYSEALGNDGNPAQWEIREINDIMNNCSDWIAFSNPRHFPEPYRRQKGWEKPDNRGQDFQPITKEQMEQLSLPPEWMEG